jgi:hypothetical protein
LAFSEFPLEYRNSLKFCALKFTQTHILAFLNFLYFFSEFFTIISVTRFSLTNFPKPRNQFQNLIYISSFLLSLAHWPSVPIPQASPASQSAHQAHATPLFPFSLLAPAERRRRPLLAATSRQVVAHLHAMVGS